MHIFCSLSGCSQGQRTSCVVDSSDTIRLQTTQTQDASLPLVSTACDVSKFTIWVQVRNQQPPVAHPGILRRRRPHVAVAARHAAARKLHTRLRQGSGHFNSVPAQQRNHLLRPEAIQHPA